MNINGVVILIAYWEWGHYGKSACTNALLVDWTRQENTCNARSIVTSSTQNAPSGIYMGIRDVHIISNQGIVGVVIYGIDANSQCHIWMNCYNGSWTGWQIV